MNDRIDFQDILEAGFGPLVRTGPWSWSTPVIPNPHPSYAQNTLVITFTGGWTRVMVSSYVGGRHSSTSYIENEKEARGVISLYRRLGYLPVPDRVWYVSPARMINVPCPGVFDYSGEPHWNGPNNELMSKMRGPFETCKEAADAARWWNEREGRQSELYLVLVENKLVTHCNLFDPDQE